MSDRHKHDPGPPTNPADREVQTCQTIEQARLLIRRLERISADSVWAHRSSGLRGALLRIVDEWEHNPNASSNRESPGCQDLNALIEVGFGILENAARDY